MHIPNSTANPQSTPVHSGPERASNGNRYGKVSTAKDMTDGFSAMRSGRKIVSSPMPSNLSPVDAIAIDGQSNLYVFGRHENRCLNIIRSPDDAVCLERKVDFDKQMLVTYRSKLDCSEGQ